MPPAPAKAAAPRTAADIAKPLSLSPPALALLTPGIAVRAFFEALAAKPELAEDAIKFLAGALPKRESVWWGYVSVKGALKEPLPEPVAKALVAVEKWVKTPNEPNRRATGIAADAVGRDTAAGCLASGAHWSGGSMAPPKQPAVAPPDHLTAVMVAVSMTLAAAAEPLKMAESRARFLALGQQVAAGQLKW
jgi:hypothetical protein